MTQVTKCCHCCQGVKVIWLQWKCADLFPKPVWPGAGFLCRVHKPVYTVRTVPWEQTGPCHAMAPGPLCLCPRHCAHSLPSGFWGVKYTSSNYHFIFCFNSFFFQQSTSLHQISERKQFASWLVFSIHWTQSWIVPIILTYGVFVLRVFAIARCFSLLLLCEAQNCNICCKTHSFVS